jgi:predicted RNA-binding protein with PIN domain
VGDIVISYIIIDGYNVIGIFHKDMEKARDSLLDVMIDYRKVKDHDITVIFDGYKNGMATQQVLFRDNVKVIFTRLGERADDVIKKTVSQERKEWLVVTADRDIADHVWAAGSVAVAPEKFLDIIMRQHRIDADEVSEAADDDYDDERHERKGNPFRLSKKEKALRRILGKL